ncbi:MAG TPA: LacI family DNA-binding transcriptional regulator [Microbacteriaceae bacterium]|nr:LacI family DNA-binding transcriptional regulator [Microbacteriaceae bacterium]
MGATVRGIARRSGVSISTVSRALSGSPLVAAETSERVWAAAEELGYTPSRRPRATRERRGVLGVVVPDLGNPFFGAICKGIQERARANGYLTFVADSGEDPTEEGEILRGLHGHADGVILCSPRVSDRQILQAAAETHLVLANRHSGAVPSVVFDNRAGMRSAVQHLVALGHRTIGYVGGPATSWSNTQRAEAFAGFGGERAPHGLELLDLGTFPPYFSGGVQAADVVVAAGVTAAVAYNDLMALGLVDRLHERGLRVPADISVVGIDGAAAATFVRPNLTTVELPCLRMGRLAVDVLVGALRAAGPTAGAGRAEAAAPAEEVLATRLLVRQSTGVPPGGAASVADARRERDEMRGEKTA